MENITQSNWSANPKEQYYNGSKNTFEVNFGNDGECVAEVVHGIENAKLIAAAPELLEALQVFTNDYATGYRMMTPAMINNAQKAIHKALGL